VCKDETWSNQAARPCGLLRDVWVYWHVWMNRWMWWALSVLQRGGRLEGNK